MKYRLGFVSNSSSTSFQIPLNVISKKQNKIIRNHLKEGMKRGFFDTSSLIRSITFEGLPFDKNVPFVCGMLHPEKTLGRSRWRIRKNKTHLIGIANSVGHFDMRRLFREIGIKKEHIVGRR